MRESLVTQQSMPPTRQPASIVHSLWADVLDAVCQERMPIALPVLQLTENSTSHWLAKVAKMLAHDLIIMIRP
jgi:hypothetical protein